MLRTGSSIEETSNLTKLKPLIFQIRKTEDLRNEITYTMKLTGIGR